MNEIESGRNLDGIGTKDESQIYATPPPQQESLIQEIAGNGNRGVVLTSIVGILTSIPPREREGWRERESKREREGKRQRKRNTTVHMMCQRAESTNPELGTPGCLEGQLPHIVSHAYMSY